MEIFFLSTLFKRFFVSISSQVLRDLHNVLYELTSSQESLFMISELGQLKSTYRVCSNNHLYKLSNIPDFSNKDSKPNMDVAHIVQVRILHSKVFSCRNLYNLMFLASH